MTKREKVLAMIVAATLLVVGGIYLIDRITTAFDQRYDQQIALDDKLATQNATLTRGNRAARDLRELRSRSLPEKRALAQALYLDWLGKRADAVGLQGRKVTPASGRQEGNVYYVHRFLLSGNGDLKQLTQFLYDFYSVDHIHRIFQLNIDPIDNSKRLRLTFTIEAVAMNGAPDVAVLAEPPSDRLARPDLEAYVNTIISRNFFSPANQAPKAAATTSQSGNPNKPMSFKLQGSDPESDPLSFYLDGDAPEGLKVQPSGEVTWTPTELGEYEFKYRVEDGGLPSKSAEGVVMLAIVDPPPPVATPVAKPGFDPATQATISGITESGGLPAIWINVRTEGKVLKLRVGDEVSVGTIQGKIAKIRVREKDAEITTSDGGTLVVTLGDSLVEA